jgi:hypothetical protein
MLLALVSCAGPVQPVPAPASPAHRGPWLVVKYDDQKRPIGNWLTPSYKTGPLAQWVEFRGADGKMVRVSGSFSIKEQ